MGMMTVRSPGGNCAVAMKPSRLTRYPVCRFGREALPAARIETLRARFAASRMRRNFVHLREEARFTLHLLKEPEKALRLAKENWGIHREPVDTRILLETALAAKAPSEAKAVLDWVKKSRLEDVKILPLARQLQGASQ